MEMEEENIKKETDVNFADESMLVSAAASVKEECDFGLPIKPELKSEEEWGFDDYKSEPEDDGGDEHESMNLFSSEKNPRPIETRTTSQKAGHDVRHGFSLGCHKCEYRTESWASLKRHVKSHCHLMSGTATRRIAIVASQRNSEEGSASFADCFCVVRPLREDVLRDTVRASLFPVQSCAPRLPYLVNDSEVTGKIANACKFACKICNIDTSSAEDFKLHLIGRHCDKVVNASGLIRYISEVRYHLCRLCCKIIPCDRLFIENHVQNVHKCPLTKYRMIPLRKMSMAERNAQLREHVKPSTFVPLSNNPAAFARMTLLPLERNNVSQDSICDEVEDLCSYMCHRCKNVLPINIQQFRAHLRMCTNRVTLYREHFHEIRYHDCYLCAARIFCDTTVIEAHVIRTHKIGPDEYKTKRQGKQTQFSRTFHDEGLKVPILPGFSNPCNALNERFITKKLGNLCLFACDKCPFETSSWTSMKDHNWKSPHGSKSVRFDSKYVKEAQYHRCIVCLKVILCDNGCLFMHCYKIHKIKLAQYKEMVKKHGIGNDIDTKMLEPDGKGENFIDALHKKVPTVACEKYFRRGDVMADDVPLDLTTDEVADLCRFSCYKCPFKTTSWTHLRPHFKKQHEGVTFNFERRLLLEARLHRCKVCQKAVYCDKAMILLHLRNFHKIFSLERYKATDKQETLQYRAKAKPNQTRLVAYNRTLNKRQVASCFAEQLENFSCNKCHFHAKEYKDIRSHIFDTRHGIEEGKNFKHSRVKAAISFVCHICGKAISCTGSSPMYHAQREHGFERFFEFLEDLEGTKMNPS